MSSLSRKSRVFMQIASVAQERDGEPGLFCGERGNDHELREREGTKNCRSGGRSQVPRVPVGASTAMQAGPHRSRDERGAARVGQFGTGVRAEMAAPRTHNAIA